MNDIREKIDMLWDDEPVDVTAEANFIWSIANKLRGTYMPDKYGDVIIPMTILRRFECALSHTKQSVIEMYEKNPKTPSQALEKKAGFKFYNVSHYDLKELLNESEKIAENFESYIEGFSDNVKDILKQLKLSDHIKTMDEGGCLFTVVKAFSELDLDPTTYDSIKMGYIFENLIGRFYQNVDAGQYYTGRDIIKCLVSILTSEGSDDIFEDHKVITVCDQACGTGGMLSTAYSYLKHINPSADVRLFGQEYMGPSYAIGLAEMLIKGQDASNFKHADTFKSDCFKDVKMRFVIENPPFGTPWKGDDAKEGQEEAVLKEFENASSGNCRWPAGLPGGGDSQLIFMQSAIDKMDDKVGRAAIIENGSPLFTGDTSSGESQIRRWMLEHDLIEAIVALPTDLFYNTGIQTYVWILSKNKRKEREGKIQLIDASTIYHKLRKGLGYKKNELSPEDRKRITELYVNFEENEFVKIYDNTEFIYREYTTMRPMHRNYSLSNERIDSMIQKGVLSSIYDVNKVFELENSLGTLNEKQKMQLEKFKNNKDQYDAIVTELREHASDKVFMSRVLFENHITKLGLKIEKKLLQKIIDGLSEIDAKAEIQKDKKGNIIYDKETKDTEIVKWDENIDDYMAREVLPYVSDSKAFFEGNNENATFEEDRGQKTIKIGAEIAFTRYFYKYKQPEKSELLEKQFNSMELDLQNKIKTLFGGKM